MGLALGKAVLLMAVVFIAARLAKRYPLRRLFRPGAVLQRFVAKLKGKETLFAVVLVFVIAFASFSEFLGLDFVVGAFFGSMLLSHELLGKENFEEIQKTASNVTMGFLGRFSLPRLDWNSTRAPYRIGHFIFAILRRHS